VDDATAPVTTAALSQPANAAGWHKSDVTVTLTAGDGSGGGVDHLTYAAIGAQPMPPTDTAGASTSFVINTAGTTVIQYFATDNVGNNEGFKTLTIKLDPTKPTISAPKAKFVAVTRLPASTIPVFVYAWQATDPGSAAASGLNRYWFQGSTDGGALQTLTLPSLLAPSDKRYLAPGHSYQFQIAGVDNASNVGKFASGAAFDLELHQDDDPAVTYTAGWDLRNHAYASGGTTHATSAAGQTVTFTFTGTDIAWISTRGVDRGRPRCASMVSSRRPWTCITPACRAGASCLPRPD
jgi:hypothetical protein